MHHIYTNPYSIKLITGIIGVTSLLGGSLGSNPSEVQHTVETHVVDSDDEPSPIMAADEQELAAAEIKEEVIPRSDDGGESLKRHDVEILWLARIIYSETKRAEEQRLIAWIVRNRVETGFRGDTYKEVALSHKQFSGLHTGDPQYYHNISRTFESQGEAWKSALATAREVYWADGSERPFAKTVRHFYSPRSASKAPAWSLGKTAVHTIVDPANQSVRFAFYEGIQ